MNKKFLALLIIFMLAFTSVPAFADDEPEYGSSIEVTQDAVIFEDTITVTKQGGSYNIGFITLVFKRNFLDDDRLPVTFHVQIFAKNGETGVEISPSTEGFRKDVQIKVHRYRGFLYDVEQRKNIPVVIKKQHITAEHFSWFRFR